MLIRIEFDQVMHGQIKIISLFKYIAGIRECFCHYSIQDHIALRNGIPGPDHTEFELISCKCKR